MVKRLPANAGDMGSVPGLERSYMRWYNLAVSLPLTPSTLFPTYEDLEALDHHSFLHFFIPQH